MVTTTKTGTLSANAKPRCSLVIPTMPALLPTCPNTERKVRPRETEVAAGWSQELKEGWVRRELSSDARIRTGTHGVEVLGQKQKSCR